MKYLTVGALALVIAAPAAAQTGPSVTSGGRVEARLGWDRAHFKDRVYTDDFILTRKDHESGIAYGVELGYDYVPGGQLLIGAYAGLEGSNIKDCTNSTLGDRNCLKFGRNITAGARLGYVMGRGVVYLKGGYSNGQLKQSFVDADFPLDEFRRKKNFGGLHFGAGGEVMISRNVYGKIEYVYTDYKNDLIDENGRIERFDPKRHQVIAGVGIRF